MSEPSLITIVVPTWNRCELVQATVASIRDQTYENWELIVVDDGSTDETVEQLEALAEPRLRVLSMPHIGSPGRLRNAGVAAGKGEWVAFLDSDDLWHPEKLQTQLAAVNRAGTAWCYTNCRLIDAYEAPIAMRGGTFRPLSGWIANDLLAERTGAYVGTLLISRCVFDELGGFHERFHYLEDLEFEIRLALTAKATALPDALVTVRDHPGRRTTHQERPHEIRVELYKDLLTRLPDRRSRRITRRKCAFHMGEAGAQRLAQRDPWQGLRLLAGALALGDHPAHWLRAAARGIRNSVRRS